MKRAVLFLTLAAGLTASGVASAGFETGNKLYDSCTAEKGATGYSTYLGLCVGYITAIADSMDCKRTVGDLTWMPDEGVTAGQLMKVVVKWLDNNPQYLNYNASSVVAIALSEAFPCPK